MCVLCACCGRVLIQVFPLLLGHEPPPITSDSVVQGTATFADRESKNDNPLYTRMQGGGGGGGGGSGKAPMEVEMSRSANR